MKSIIEEIEDKYRSNPLCGVQWSIDADAYDCNEIVEFGEFECWCEKCQEYQKYECVETK